MKLYKKTKKRSLRKNSKRKRLEKASKKTNALKSSNNSIVKGNKDVRKIWSGYGFDVLFGLVYLMKKYSSLCFPIDNPTNRLRSITLSMVCNTDVKEAKKERLCVKISRYIRKASISY